MVRCPVTGYDSVMELVACFAAFALLVAGWLVSGRRVPATEQ